MMLPAARIVVIDDNESDVRAIVTALNSLGTSSVGVHYSPEWKRVSFPCLRILFLDLHLHEGGGSNEQQIKLTIDLLPSLLSKNHGPYVIVLWSGHASEKDLFEQTLDARLSALEITAPLAVIPLDKISHVPQGRVDDPEGLREAVLAKIREIPQLAAILGWEEHVAQAVNDTICQIVQMARRNPEGAIIGLNRILGELAVATAGLESARDDSFRPTNEVLVQIVADRLLHRGVDSTLSQLWRVAVTDLKDKSGLEGLDAARLNSLLHLEGEILGGSSNWERGKVLNLSLLEEGEFLKVWGTLKDNIKEDFFLKDATSEIKWIAIQVRPACDEAHMHSGLLPYVLGISTPPGSTNWLDRTKKAKHLWVSPEFATQTDEIYRLLFHLRFVAGLHRDRLRELDRPLFCRLRESLVAELTHELHSYSGRPGLIRFPR